VPDPFIFPQTEQMNGIVDELSALVGGSSQVNTGAPSITLKTSDQAFHQIAGGASKAPAAEQSIPLGKATDFNGFNGQLDGVGMSHSTI
jgi:hypothetical protein